MQLLWSNDTIGRITHFKFHLSHTDPYSNTKKCPRVPLKVKQEIIELLKQKSKARVKRVVDIEEIQVELQDTMGGRDKHIIKTYFIISCHAFKGSILIEMNIINLGKQLVDHDDLESEEACLVDC